MYNNKYDTKILNKIICKTDAQTQNKIKSKQKQKLNGPNSHTLDDKQKCIT
jgi:hypothetical protein